jgi:hypothetical protein
MRRAGPGLVAAAGLALVVAGVAVFWAANVGGAGVPEAAYAPLEPGQPARYTSVPASGGAVLWTLQHATGAAVVVLGLLVLAGIGGWLLGRRSGRS